ncbi:dUTP diphosphatase [Corynebacterium glutamicum]|uniref:dUTP diphosphatase n=1 Tax=Corynebacterium glutamicum TaxID=1718 RepID=UPI0003134C84|nr:dUTP diphosphatase [Corynebacterium glutamicum]
MIDAIILLILFSTIIYFSWAIKKVADTPQHLPMQSDKWYTLPTRAHKHDAGLDLKAAKYQRIPVNGRATIDTRFRANIPAGYVGLVFSRSGHGTKGIRLANSVGVIDAGYTGTIMVSIENYGAEPFEIQPGDRVAQMVIVPIITPALKRTETFTTTDRGTKGLGSTGK